jgi:hypothetical protein
MDPVSRWLHAPDSSSSQLLLYIGNAEVMSVFARFATAAIVSRVILHFEIGGMIDRERNKHRVFRGVMQSDSEGELEEP